MKTRVLAKFDSEVKCVRSGGVSPTAQIVAAVAGDRKQAGANHRRHKAYLHISTCASFHSTAQLNPSQHVTTHQIRAHAQHSNTYTIVRLGVCLILGHFTCCGRKMKLAFAQNMRYSA